jgi:hypothetical protein
MAGRECEVATYSRIAYSSALKIVGLGMASSDSEGGDAAASSKLFARVDAAAYAAVKRQRDVSFMLGISSGVGRC